MRPQQAPRIPGGGKQSRIAGLVEAQSSRVELFKTDPVLSSKLHNCPSRPVPLPAGRQRRAPLPRHGIPSPPLLFPVAINSRRPSPRSPISSHCSEHTTPDPNRSSSRDPRRSIPRIKVRRSSSPFSSSRSAWSGSSCLVDG